jgi:hypothetical protein
VKAAPKGDKEGGKLKLHWYHFFFHEGPWLCDEKEGM